MAGIQPIKIAHVSAVFPPYWSGMGNVAYFNALELARRGHDVHVFTARSPTNEAYIDPAELHVHRLWTPFRIGNAPLTPHLLTCLKDFDIVHLHWPYIFGAEITWLALHYQEVPYVLTYHIDLRRERKWVFGPYQSFWGPRLVGRAKKVIAVNTEHLKSSQVYPALANRGNDTVEVPNGVDLQLFNPEVDGDRVRKLYGIPENAFVFLFVGALDSAHEYKGVPDLLQAFAKLNQPKAWLLIIGEGDLLPKYQQLAAGLGEQFSQRTIFSGGVNHENLPAYYAAGNVCVLPSHHTESFGMVLVEAMACGIPVVASDLPGVRLVVTRGADGYLFSPGNVDDLTQKLQQVLSLAPATRIAMGEAGRRKVTQNYTWEIAAQKLEAIYASVLQAR